jgi:hypothetical protein
MTIEDKVSSTDLGPTEAEVDIWFNEMIEKGLEGPFSFPMKVYPVHAKKFLSRNKDNRKLSNLFVNRLSKDAVKDKYDLNGESFKFSVEGDLNDGQHRGLAILKSEIPIESFVTFGLSRQSRMTLDQGKPRTTANYLSMDGRKNATKAASVSALLIGYYQYEGRDVSKDNVVTKQDVREYYYENSDKIDYAISHTNKKEMIPFAPTSSLATAYFILQEEDFDNVDTFYDPFMSGVNIDEDNPIKYLRDHLLNRELSPRERIILILQYWIKWKKGEKLKRKLKLQGKYPDLKEIYS